MYLVVKYGPSCPLFLLLFVLVVPRYESELCKVLGSLPARSLFASSVLDGTAYLVEVEWCPKVVLRRYSGRWRSNAKEDSRKCNFDEPSMSTSEVSICINSLCDECPLKASSRLV